MIAETITGKFSPQYVSRYIADIFDKALSYLGGFNVYQRPETVELPVSGGNNEYHYKTIADILNDINRTIMELEYPAFNANTTRSTIKMMNAMGPMAIPTEIDLGELQTISSLPSIVFISSEFSGEKRGFIYPSMFYASKLDKKTIECAHMPGTIYECGMVYPDQKKTVWLSLFCSVVDGKVIVAKKIPQVKIVKIRSKNNDITYVDRKCWGRQRVITDYMADHKVSEEEAERRLSICVASYFSVWEQRENYWRVSARKGGKRVTFLIAEKDPKKLFKNRDVTIRTPSGQKKRIIHCVTEHTRISRDGKESAVKEHLRGLRQFTWRGTACSVIAPRFHGVDSDTFKAPAVVTDKGKGTISGPSLWKAMAEAEDCQSPEALHGLVKH